MTKYHNIKSITFKDNVFVVTIENSTYKFDLNKISRKLSKASKIERETFTISPSGYGIHWPLLDEDLSIDGLLGKRHKPDIKKSVLS